MRKIMIAGAAMLATMGTAGAASDWLGTVRNQAAYDDLSYNPPRGEVELTVDAVYDRPGHAGKAWGTMSLMYRTQAGVPMISQYLHVICVGKFPSGRWSVAGQIDKAVGQNAGNYPNFMTFEYDTDGTAFRTFDTTTLKDAKATCDTQSGVYPGTFNHGWFLAK